MNPIHISDLANTTTLTLKRLIEGRKQEALNTLSAELRNRLSFTTETNADWDSDENGAPTCRTITTLKLACDGEEIATGRATGFFSHSKRQGGHWSSWQDADSPYRDNAWNLIAQMLVTAEVIHSIYDLDETIEAPPEPEKPEEDDTGEYVVLYRGWEQTWTINSRHATKENAQRASRNADRAATERNINGYGWQYEVAVVDEDGTLQVEGLKLTICRSQEP